MRLFNFIINKTNVFFMGWVFDYMDHCLMESKILDKLPPFFQFITLLIIIPLIILASAVILTGMSLYYIEKIITKLIYRNTISIIRCKIPGADKILKDKEKILFKNLKKDFGYKFNYYYIPYNDSNKNNTIYFLKESDLSWFIIKYSEYIIKKT